MLTTGKILSMDCRANITNDEKIRFARAIEAEVRAEAQEPVAFPIPPAGIITHQNLGELYDRLQMQQYAMKYADITAQQMPAPCPGCVELESKWLSEQARNLAEEADYEHMSIDVFAMQAKVAELEARPAARYMNTNARLETIVAEQSAEIERLTNERDEYNSAWQRSGVEYRKLRDSLLSLAGEFK